MSEVHDGFRATWCAALAVVCASLAWPAEARTISRDSEYWPVLQKLEAGRSNFEALDETCQRLRDLKDALVVAERVSKPVLPALGDIENSRTLKILGRAPVLGDIATTAQATAAATRAGLGALAWAHKVDQQAIRPLTDAVNLSNEVLRTRDDGPMPRLLDAYEQSQHSLGRADANLGENLEQTGNMLQLTRKLHELLRRAGGADSELGASLDQLESALSDLLAAEQASQEQVERSRSFVTGVLSVAPDSGPPRPGSTAHPRPSAKAPNSGLVKDQSASTVRDEQGATPQEPESSAPVGGEQTTPPAESTQVAAPPAVRDARSPAMAASGAKHEGNSPWVLVGGMAVLAAGLGALAWIVVQFAGPWQRRGKPRTIGRR